MCEQLRNFLPEVTSIASVLAAIFSGWCAYLSYKLSSRLREEMKSDETLIASKLIHSSLVTREHDDCVITCNLFNKSKRKVFVSEVRAYDSKNNPIAVTWSNQIDQFGNPLRPCELIGIVDTESLFIRENMGKAISFCRLEICHSFSTAPLVVVFDAYAVYHEEPI
jgi:hypothetical protein